MSALEYLQSPDLNCPVSSALLSLLATDSSPDVRRCALNKITVSDRSLPGENLLVMIQYTGDFPHSLCIIHWGFPP